MKPLHFIVPLLALLARSLVFPEPVLAQRGAPTNSLARALTTFSAAETDKDGRLSARELSAIPIPREDFPGIDQDADGFWSRDEFLIFYRQKLVAAGQQVGQDLEAEIGRIHALRKAKQERGKAERASEDTARVNPARAVENPPVRPGAAGPSQRVQLRATSSDEAKEALLAAALDDLERRAAAGQAVRADFDQVRSAVAAAGSGNRDPASDETYRKLLRSLESLEKSAAEGVYSREQYAEMRASMIRRARNIVPTETASRSALHSQLENALDQLEQRVAAREASPEDYDRVRAQWTALAGAANRAGEASQDRRDGTGAANSVADSGSETYRKLLQSLDRLEARAKEGAYPREEYQALREQMIQRARAIAAAAPSTETSTTTIGDTAAIEAGLKQALDDLEMRAAAGQASREEFQRVREHLIARARAAAQSEAGAGSGAEWHHKLMQALDRLEQRAAQGVYAREEYAELRAALIRRARGAEAPAQQQPDPAVQTRKRASESRPPEEPRVRREPPKEPPPPERPQRDTENASEASKPARPAPKPDSGGRPRRI